jgi:hypothetical protein
MSNRVPDSVSVLVSVLVSVGVSLSFAVRRDGARTESLEALDSQAIFAALRIGARCCGVIKMALKAAALPLSYASQEGSKDSIVRARVGNLQSSVVSRKYIANVLEALLLNFCVLQLRA